MNAAKYFEKSRGLTNKVLKDLLFRWVLSFTIFKIVYETFNFCLYHKRLAYYDPSGHFLCALVSYGNWTLVINFIEDLTVLMARCQTERPALDADVSSRYSMYDQQVARFLYPKIQIVLIAIQQIGYILMVL